MQASFNFLNLAVLLIVLPACLLAAKVSDQCCADLGFPAGQGSDAVCASANVPAVGCNKAVTGKRAARICKNAGARLCTRKELRNGEGKGTGCGLRNALVWTSSKCDGKGTAWVVVGKNGKQKDCYSKQAAAFTAGVICCADVCDTTEPTEAPEEDITIFYVGSGSFSEPYFPFFSDPAGENAIDTPSLVVGETYRFELIASNSGHPFAIGENYGDTTLSDDFQVEDGSITSGLTEVGDFVQFTLPEDTGVLLFYCLIHSFMEGTLFEAETVPEDMTIYVGSGSFSEPYYPFFSDAAGENPIDTPVTLQEGVTYRFELIAGNSFHPFAIGPSNGDTSLTTGLTQVGSFVEFTAESDLLYYCLAHPSMVASLALA